MPDSESRLRVTLPFNPAPAEDTKAFAKRVIQNHESKFRPYFDRHIDEDARYTFQEGSLEVSDVALYGTSGFASVTFTSDFYSGCRDQNGTYDHDAVLDFNIENCQMVFDIELPTRWSIDN